MISPINVLRCPDLESILKRKLEHHFKAKAKAENTVLLI
jgi:hypothetical protein